MTAHSPLQAVPQDTVNRNAPALPPTFLNLRVSHNELLTAELLRKQGPAADLAPRSPAASSRAPLNGHQPLMTAVRPHESTGYSELRQSGVPDGCGGGGDGDRDRHEGCDGEESREGGDGDDPNHNPGTARPRIRHRRGNGKTRAEPAESAGNKCPCAGADVQIRGPAGALERKSEVLGDGTSDAHRRNVSDGARVESETKVDIEAEVMMDAGRESGEDVSEEANHPQVGSDGAGPDEDVGACRDGGSPERVVDQGKGSAGGQEEEEVNGRGDAEDADALQDGAQGLRSFYGMRNTGGSDEDSSWTTLSQGSAVWSSPDDADELWDDCSHDEADPALPPGWKKIRDTSGTYYWHIPTGTTQWEPPSPPSATFPPATVPDNLVSVPLTPVSPFGAAAWFHTGTSRASQQDSHGFDLQAESTHPDPSLKEFEGATLRYASLKLGGDMDEEEGDCMGCDLPCNPEAKCFAVRSLGWVEMSEEDLAPGRSSIAVNNCIRQLSYRKSDIRDTAGIWGEGKDMFLLLEKDLLTLVDPMDQGVLHSQPIINIRVWGVGRDNGRDFAYVARDKLTRVLKCHVFRCDTPAKAIATSLHEICARIMAERRSAKSCASSCAAELGQQLHEAPLQVEFPTAKMESVQKFHVLYVGSMAVDRPAGMEVLNDSIDALMAKSVKEDWEPVVINVAPATVAICKEKQGDEVVFECRVRFLSFLGVGRDARSFAFIMAATPHRFECHAFWCEPNCAGLSEAVQAACVLRYQKCLDARPGALKPRGPSQPADSVARRVGCSVRKGVQSLFGSLRPRRSPLPDTP
ncbi:unnamed protein product [Lampetra fluviatilis]